MEEVRRNILLKAISTIINIYSNITVLDLEKGSKHIEWVRVTKSDGTTYMRRQNKVTPDEDVKEPKSLMSTFDKNALIDKISTAHYYEGKFYNSNGNEIHIPEDWKEFAKKLRFNDSKNAEIVVDGLNTYKDNTEREQQIKAYKEAERQNFLPIEQKILEKKKELENFNSRNANKQKKHIEEDRIKNRLKYASDQINEPSLNNTEYGNTKFYGTNLNNLLNKVNSLSGYFNDPDAIYVNYKIKGSGDEHFIRQTLMQMKDSIETKIAMNNEFVKTTHRDQWKKKVDASKFPIKIGQQITHVDQGLYVSPNEAPFELKDFKIDSLKDMNLSDFNLQGATTVNYKDYGKDKLK